MGHPKALGNRAALPTRNAPQSIRPSWRQQFSPEPQDASLPGTLVKVFIHLTGICKRLLPPWSRQARYTTEDPPTVYSQKYKQIRWKRPSPCIWLLCKTTAKDCFPYLLFQSKPLHHLLLWAYVAIVFSKAFISKYVGLIPFFVFL